MNTLAFHLGPFQFDQPWWLVLLPVCWVLVVWIGRQTLSGMGTTARRVSLVVRLILVLLIVGAVARPQWRRDAKSVNVAAIIDVSDSTSRTRIGPDGKPVSITALSEAFLAEAAKGAKRGDTYSRLTAARKSYVQSLPTPPDAKPEIQTIGATDGTNLADAITLALAIPGLDADQSLAAKRILLFSDGNQTAGDVLTAASAAKAAGVPIDVRPLRYKFENEVIIDKIVTPTTARMGQNVNLRVMITSLKAASGRVTLMVNGDPVKLGDGANEMGMRVTLDAGPNVITIPVSLPVSGPQRFEAVFEPDDGRMDSIAQNNRSMAVTFVQGEGRILVLTPNEAEVLPLERVLQQARLSADIKTPAEAPETLVDWGAYDAVILANVHAGDLSQQKQEDLKSYVHDLGGGLIMVGGPESFGAGGWIGSPVADALPVKLDPPQQRQMPRGALVMVMHSCEMPRGNYWGQQVCMAAINNLSRLDMAGVVEYSWTKGDWWVYPLSEIGNKSGITRAINSLTFGDMKVLDGLIKMSIQDLEKADAGAKHMIIISDGDATLSDRSLLARAAAGRISISTVLVYPHGRGAGGPDWSQMQDIARQTNGRAYSIIDEGEFAKLPSIFIKEAQIVRRTLIWEGPAFVPTIVNTVSEPMRGLTREGIPPITGYVVAAEREGLSVVTLRGKENDPILAHWQFGLGKSVAFTSDTAVRWAKAWPSWDKYRAFWEQHVRWAMRPGGSADMRVMTEDMGDRTRLIVEASDQTGERLNFVQMSGRVVGPGNQSSQVSLRQTGPGRYEGVFDSASAGAYVTSLRYSIPGAEGQPSREGTVLAAVTRPYADEFRTLEDNASLLKLVAERTGGRVISDDPAKAELFLRDGMKMPADARPIWMLVSLIALGVFLLDVAVRRVRIDPEMIASAFRRGMGRGAERANQQLGSLKEARDRAQQGISGASAQERTRPAAPTPADGATAGAKFEVGEEELRASKAVTGLADPNAPAPVKVVKTEQPTDAQGEGGLSRLKKARERAQGKFEDEEKPGA
jgi:uncharacterized membrane protein